MRAPTPQRLTPAIGWPSWWVRAVVLGMAFAVADALASLTSGGLIGVAGIWVPGGIGLAGLLLGGLSLWPALVVGGLASAPAYGVIGPPTVPIVLANVAAVLVAAWAIRALGTDPRLGRLGDVGRFVLGCTAGALPFGAAGVGFLLALGPSQAHAGGALVALWILSTLTGFVVVGGAVTVLGLRRREPVHAWRVVESVIGLVLAAALAAMVFVGAWAAFIIPLLLVIALVAGRGGPRAAAVVSLVVFGFAGFSVLDDGGPFAGGDLDSRSLTYQTAVLVLALGVQAIGAIGSGEPGAVPETPGRGLALGLLVGGGLALGLSEAVVAPELILKVPKAQVTLIGMLMALVVVLGVLVGTGLRGHAAAVRVAGQRWVWLVVVAGLALFGAEELFLLALGKITVIAALVLSSVAPVMLVIVALARGAVRMSPVLGGALLAVIAGYFAVVPGDGWFTGMSVGGGLLALGSSACSAILLLALGAARSRTHAGPIAAGAFAVGALSALIMCAVLGKLPAAAVFTNEEVLGGILYLAILGLLIPVVVAIWALPLMGAARVAMFEVLAPPMGVLAALAWHETSVNVVQVLGSLLLVAGLALVARAHGGAHDGHRSPPRGAT